jgi:Mg-chelatase subunit ChlD
VKTGEWDDNANFREYTRWLASEKWSGVAKIDASARRFLVVRDAAGKPVPSCSVKVSDGAGKSVNLLTTSNGRALFFPAAENLKRGGLVATARCQGGVATQSFTSAPGDAVVELNLPGMRALPQAQTLDVAFILDTTGSMSEEIDALRETLQKVADQVKGLNVRVRVGLVEFKDRGDTYVTRMHQMTTDIAGMQARIGQIEASGGGDQPEHVNQAVRVAVNGLAWKPESIARLAFLIGDAPPHLDYQDDEGYAGAVKQANHEGIQIYTIAASGMAPVGQVVWRQLAQLTAATHMFVLRGGAGPQSTGGGDPRDSCGGTHTDYRSGALDALIASKIKGALAARDADPMRIAGLGKDEKEKPCDQRVVMAQ